MSIQPQLIVAPGEQGVLQRIADIARQVADLQQTAGGGGTAGTPPPGSITGGMIAYNTITAANIHAGTITAVEIAANTITATLIQAGTITAAQIAANSITAGQIAAATITSAQIAANTITGTQIAAGTITGSLIASGSITASELNVAQLSAVTSDMGAITAGIFSTGTSGPRVLMGSAISTSSGSKSGVVGIDALNDITFLLDATTGDVTLKGALVQGSTGLGNVQGVTQNAILIAQGNNLVDNPSVDDVGLDMFYSTGVPASIGRDTTTYLTAPASVLVAAASSGSVELEYLQAGGTWPAASTGSPYSTSTFVYSGAATTLAMNLEIQFYDSSFAFISSENGPTINVPPGQWTRLYLDNAIAPSGTSYAAPFAIIPGGTAGDTFNFDNFLLVNHPSAQGSMILADSITATEIAAGTITAAEIAAGTITGTNIAANSITAGNLSVGSLSAVSSILGTVTAGTITSTTIIGGTVESSTSNPKTGFDPAGIWLTDSAGSKIITVEPANGVSMSCGIHGYNRVSWNYASATSGIELGWITTQGGAGLVQMDLIAVNGAPGPTPGGGSLSLIGDYTSDAANQVKASAGSPVSGGVIAPVVLTDGTGMSAFNNVTIGQGGSSGTLFVNGSTFTFNPGSSFFGPYAYSGSGAVGAASGNSGNPSNQTAYITMQYGAIPGFAGNTYPVLKSSFLAWYFVINNLFSAWIDPTGTYHFFSSEEVKNSFTPIPDELLLNKIRGLRLDEWEYDELPGVRHIGPLAEDFTKTFSLGHMVMDPEARTEPEHGAFLAVTDIAGVALAGVQAVAQKLDDLESQISVADVLDALAEADDFKALKKALLAADLQHKETRHYRRQTMAAAPEPWMSDKFKAALTNDVDSLAEKIETLQPTLAVLQADQ